MSFNYWSFNFLTYTDITRKIWLQTKQGAVRFGFPSVKGRFIHRLSTRKIWILNLPHVSFCSCTVLTQANSSCFSVCKTGLELSVLEGSSRKICTNLPVTAFLWAKEEVFSFGKRKLIYEKWCDFLGWGLYWELFGRWAKDESGIAGSEDQPCFLLYMQTARLTRIPWRFVSLCTLMKTWKVLISFNHVKDLI